MRNFLIPCFLELVAKEEWTSFTQGLLDWKERYLICLPWIWGQWVVLRKGRGQCLNTAQEVEQRSLGMKLICWREVWLEARLRQVSRCFGGMECNRCWMAHRPIFLALCGIWRQELNLDLWPEMRAAALMPKMALYGKMHLNSDR